MVEATVRNILSDTHRTRLRRLVKVLVFTLLALTDKHVCCSDLYRGRERVGGDVGRLRRRRRTNLERRLHQRAPVCRLLLRGD